MAFPVSTRAALLQALVVPGYGTELIERVHRVTAGAVRIAVGSLYPALVALERQGLVRSSVVRARGRSGRPRVYYELTPRGLAAAEADRRLVERLFRFEDDQRPCEAASTIARRLRRCADLSSSVLELRDHVLATSARR